MKTQYSVETSSGSLGEREIWTENILGLSRSESCKSIEIQQDEPEETTFDKIRKWFVHRGITMGFPETISEEFAATQRDTLRVELPEKTLSLNSSSLLSRRLKAVAKKDSTSQGMCIPSS